MYLIFEHYKNIDNYLKQRLMLLGVKGDWVHCEIVFDEMDNVRASSWGGIGTEFVAWENIKKPSNFSLYPLPSANWKEVYRYMQEHQGSPYDNLGVVAMVYGLGINWKKGKFCSEICYEALSKHTNIALPNVKASSVSPLELRRWIINSGIKSVPSTVLNK